MADAIQFFHSKDLVHRDLKPENVLLTATDDIKIGDFGLAREFTSLKENKIAQGTVTTSYVTCYMNTCAGTPHWMAPEVFPGPRGHGHYNEKADVFSLGILFLAILKRDFIINDKGKKLYGAFVNVVGEGKVGIGYAMYKYGPAVAVSLQARRSNTGILQMIALDALKFEQKDRPTAFEILNRITSFISSVLCSQVSAQPPVLCSQVPAQPPVLGPQVSTQPMILGTQVPAQPPGIVSPCPRPTPGYYFPKPLPNPRRYYQPKFLAHPPYYVPEVLPNPWYCVLRPPPNPVNRG